MFRAQQHLGNFGKYNLKKIIITTVVYEFCMKLDLFKPAHPIVDGEEIHEIQIIKYLANAYCEITIPTHAKRKHYSF